MKGIYVCFFSVPGATLVIGALGKVTLEDGIYVYVGSAQKYAESRMLRHKRGAIKNRWHVDYLSSKYRAFSCMILENAKKAFEDELAFLLLGIYPYIKGFGASDSHVESHLFKVDDNIKNVLYNFARLKGLEWKEI